MKTRRNAFVFILAAILLVAGLYTGAQGEWSSFFGLLGVGVHLAWGVHSAQKND